MNNEKIIEKLLQIISDYQKDGILKEIILNIDVINNNTIKVTKLITKGEIGKGTPFYSGSIDTIIVNEYIRESETYHADILFSTKE